MFNYALAIVFLTLTIWLLHKARIVKVCPICAATVITWIGGLIAIYFHFSFANPLVIGILMGASLGALAEKYGYRFGFVWKSTTVLLGFSAIYFLVQTESVYKGIAIAIILLIYALLIGKFKPAEHLEKKDLFKECC